MCLVLTNLPELKCDRFYSCDVDDIPLVPIVFVIMRTFYLSSFLEEGKVQSRVYRVWFSFDLV
jgi:hypothetical protein